MNNPNQIRNKLDEIEELFSKMEEYFFAGAEQEELKRISKIMNKGCPTLKVGIFTIKYMQVPYVDRYIFVFINDMYDKQVMKMKKDLFLEMNFFNIFNIPIAKVNKFLKKIEEFDDRMDSGKDNVKTWMDELPHTKVTGFLQSTTKTCSLIKQTKE